jgi:t-SNARE complex subunit (syntaxin)|tara:strand:+ start:1137 stop:1427 length:291 start_codon:yes stop_codon:yes gene_type:complete
MPANSHDNDSQIIVALTDLTNKIETLIDKQEELALNVSKIKEVVYNPDEGLYARLNKLDIRLFSLEEWKNNHTKLLWIVISIVAGLVMTTAWKAIL